MKILQIITELGGGGAEKILAMLTEGLTAAGHGVCVVSLKAPPADNGIPDRLREAGVQIRYLNASKADPFLFWKLRRVIAEEKPDLIHSHLIHPNLLSRIAAIGLKTPLVNTIHTAEKRPGKGLYFLLDRLTFPLADAVTAVSSAAASFHEQKCGLAEGTISVIRNGAEPVQRFPAEKLEDLRRQWIPADTDTVIGCVGRLDAMKGYDLLLNRLDAVIGKIPDGKKWHLLFIGDGPDRKKLEKLAQKYQDRDRLTIGFAGFQPNAAAWLDLFDVFLTPSLCEGYGLAAAEAMSLGLPVVCSNADALPELCAQYPERSFLFDPISDKGGTDMAEKILLASGTPRGPGLQLRIPQDMIRDYLALYEKLAAKS